MKSNNELRRYTDVLSVLDMLRHQRVTLRSPLGWSDQNDRASLEAYGGLAGGGSVVALCLAATTETYHHWQVFAGHGHGVCVVFRKDAFVAHMEHRAGLICGPVRYYTQKQLKKLQGSESELLPFLKRYAFRDEKEYRIIATISDIFQQTELKVSIPLDLIDRIVFSPIAPTDLVDSAKEIMRDFDGCDSLNFFQSRLMDNLKWRRTIDALARSREASPLHPQQPRPRANG